MSNVSLSWPLVYLALLYAEWYLAWFTLGHAPIPAINDPMDIAASRWLHLPVGLAMVGLIPSAVAAIGFNLIHVEFHKLPPGSLVLRAAALLVAWAILILVVRYDPQPVGEWWAD